MDQHAAEYYPEAISFFDLNQNLYNFLAIISKIGDVTNIYEFKKHNAEVPLTHIGLLEPTTIQILTKNI